MIDGHVHIRPGKIDPEMLVSRLADCGLEGAVLISLPPDKGAFLNRIENLRKWTGKNDNLIPFFWIDPTEKDIEEQIGEAINAGAMGFKIICDTFYPSDKRCLDVCKLAAEAGKPVLFHSGILWDGKPSSEFCRPLHFEHLLSVENLRFSLAHIGWPWCDEMIAVYGKFQNFRSRNPMSEVEMYIDLTPGTPVNYREEALKKLFGTGYDVHSNLIFGTDCDANEYNADWVKQWLEIDGSIYDSIGLGENVVSGIYRGNLESFVYGRGQARNFKELKPAGL